MIQKDIKIRETAVVSGVFCECVLQNVASHMTQIH